MSSSDAMFETFLCIFPVGKWASCSCKNRPWFSCVNLGQSKSLISLLSDDFWLLGFYEWKLKGFGSKRVILQYFCEIFVSRSESYSTQPGLLMTLRRSLLTFSQTSPGFYVSVVQVFCKHCGKRRNCLLHSVFYPSGELSVIFIKFEIIFCKPFHVGSV